MPITPVINKIYTERFQGKWSWSCRNHCISPSDQQRNPIQEMSEHKTEDFLRIFQQDLYTAFSVQKKSDHAGTISPAQLTSKETQSKKCWNTKWDDFLTHTYICHNIQQDLYTELSVKEVCDQSKNPFTSPTDQQRNSIQEILKRKTGFLTNNYLCNNIQ